MRAAHDVATIRARMAELEAERRLALKRREDEQAHAEADRRTARTLSADIRARTIVRNGRVGLG